MTSRAPLHIRWEHVFEAPPLDVPDLLHMPPLEQLGQIAAVALFIDRAATQTLLISAQALLARMEHRLDLLASPVPPPGWVDGEDGPAEGS